VAADGATPRSAAERHLRANVVLQSVLAAFAVLSLLSATLNLALTLSGAGETAGVLRGLYPVPENEVERTTQIVTFAWIALWAAAALFWAPLNAWGLSKRRRWARASTIAFSVASLLACCCLPVGIYGIWSMSRRDVADLLS
jgi:hypothetical protein